MHTDCLIFRDPQDLSYVVHEKKKKQRACEPGQHSCPTEIISIKVSSPSSYHLQCLLSADRHRVVYSRSNSVALATVGLRLTD